MWGSLVHSHIYEDILWTLVQMSKVAMLPWKSLKEILNILVPFKELESWTYLNLAMLVFGTAWVN